MQVVIIRHAPAENRQEFAQKSQFDDSRPLTNKGKDKMRQNIKGLQICLPQITRIAESPLVRAQQTAGLLAAFYPDAVRESLPALAPGGSELTVLAYLQKQAHTEETIALVGHEPDLGKLATWLLDGEAGEWMPLKKGSACLLEFSDDVEAGYAELCWMLMPKQLRQLAG